MNKKVVVVLLTVVLVLIIIMAAVYLMLNKNSGGLPSLISTKSGQSKFPLQNIPAVTASLQIVQKAPPNANQIDIVYNDTRPNQNMLGFEMDVIASPAVSSAVAANITPGPNFSNANFIYPLKKVSEVKAGTLFSLAALRINPKTAVFLKNGDILETIFLSGAKPGKYQFSFDNSTTTVLNELNSNLAKPFNGTVTVNF